MSKKLVVAMSTSSLDYYPKTHNVRLLRLNIHIGKETFIDGETMRAEQFEDWLLEHPNETVKTSPPIINVMTRFFLKIADEGYDEVLLITMSSLLSRTYEYLKELLPIFADQLNIYLFDSKSAAFAEGYLALSADQCFCKGWSMEQTITYLEKLRKNNVLFFGINDLSYLVHNGRLSQRASFIANMFNVKPLIQINSQGEAIIMEKILSAPRLMNTMSNHLEHYMQMSKNYKVYLLYTGRKGEAFREFEHIVATRNNLNSLPSYPLTPVVSANTGPNCFGFGIFWA